MQEFCERFLKNPFFLRDCGSPFDERTRARLERENYETLKALQALKKRRKIARRKSVESKESDVNGIDKDDTCGIEKSNEIARRTDYRFTKWSKLRIVRARNEWQKWEEYLDQYDKWKFFTSMIKLRVILLHKEWDNTCHLHQRTIIRQKIRLEKVLRIRWKYNIDEILPNDSIIFDKIIKNEEDRKKQLELRQERMIKIIKKIAQEMNNGIRFMRKPKDRLKKITLEEISQESFEEISFEEIRSENLIPEEKIDEDASKEILPKIKKDEEDSKLKSSEDEPRVEEKTENDKDYLEGFVIKKSKSTIEQEFPEDVCFFAIPSTVTFDDFEVNKVYSRKLIIRNKTVKWAYLRFHKIYTEVWEPGIVEIDIMDAARVKPGLHVLVNVKFSPIHEEIVTADIAFLTLNQDDTENFHEFRVPVRCTPQSAIPVLEPRELRFPSAQIWKYSDLKYNQRVLTISNEGRKSFSIVIEERNEWDHYFLWHFDQAEIHCIESSIWSTSEDNEEINADNNGKYISNLEDSGKFYQIEVPPKFKCNLIISFRPRYTGVHHEMLEIRFLMDNKMLGEQSVPMWAEVVGHQIHLDPPCVDLGIVMMDSDVCQQIFNIINTGRCSVEVLIKTPKCLENQVCVYPKSTVVQTEVPAKIIVRLIPEANIVHIAKRYYDSVSNILEFPIHVQVVSQESAKPPPLVVKVLATLTTCNGLVLEPGYVDLGFVYTHESVYKELTLTNESLLVQEFAFLNLPPTVEIQPNYGFGTILPGESIKLHLIYSPCITDIPGNDIRANGLSGERSFFIQAVTVAELASSKKQTIVNKLKNSMETLSIVPRNRGFPPPLPINLKAPTSVYRQADQNDVDDHTENDSIIEEKDSKELLDKEDTLEITEEISRLDRRKEKNKIEIYAYIVDAFCELSEQIIKFPPTPCGSFSMASIHLRGFNAASYPNCSCGIVKNQNKEFTGRFEFQSSSDRVKIMPQSGVLSNNEIIEVNFLFKPRLPRRMVFEEGLRLKMNVEEQKTGREDKSPDKEGKKKKRRERAKKESPDKKQEFTEMDKFAGELSLLETFEPCVSTIFISCAIDLLMKNGTKHDEMLFAELICPITRPEILLLNEEQEIAFGPTAIGIPTKKFLFVKNISNQSVQVNVSLLDPFGPFFVPPGKTIETGSILKLPITYRPVEEREQNDEEYFEVSSKKSRTRWTVKVSGRGVVPSYVLKPQFRVARFKIVDEKPVELKISIQNTGECPLIFRVDLVDTLEGEIPPERNDFPQESVKKEKKRKGRSEAGARSPAREEFDDNLRPNEELVIFGGNLRRSVDRAGFSFWNLDEKMQLLIPDKKKMEFGIRFHLKGDPNIDDAKETAETVKGKKRAKKGLKMDEAMKSSYSYVAVLKLMLGSSTLNEFVMICSTK